MTTLTTEEVAFIAAIRDNPADDVVRLVFADWLDEHGRGAQAELVRVQVEKSELGNRLPKDMLISDMDRLRYLRDRTSALITELAPRCPACPKFQPVKSGEDAVQAVINWGNAKKNCPHCSGRGYVGTFDRGFMVEARVPSIPTVLEEKMVDCDACDASGYLLGHTDGDEDCPVCNGATVVPDWRPTDDGRDLIAHPLLARVIPVDREPNATEYGSTWNRDRDHYASSDGIPTPIFDLMKLPGVGDDSKYADAPELAIDALGTALCDVLRKMMNR